MDPVCGTSHSVALAEPTPKEQYRLLKKRFKFLVYENECYQEELRNLQRKLLKLSRDKNFLLDRLMCYEKLSDSSDDSDSSAQTRLDEKKPKRKSAKPSQPRKKPEKKEPPQKPPPANPTETANEQTILLADSKQVVNIMQGPEFPPTSAPVTTVEQAAGSGEKTDTNVVVTTETVMGQT